MRFSTVLKSCGSSTRIVKFEFMFFLFYHGMGNKTLFCDSYLRAYSVRDWSTGEAVLCEAKYEAIAEVRKARRREFSCFCVAKCSPFGEQKKTREVSVANDERPDSKRHRKDFSFMLC